MNKPIKSLLATLFFLLSQTAALHAESGDERFNEILGRLYLNHKSLSVVYSKLHGAALEALAGPDRQLGYIQKAYLFVSEANLFCRHQWELLSIIGYIKHSHRADYITLRVKGLERAEFESQDRVVSLKLYAAYIENPEARDLIDEAVGLIEADIYMYQELRALLKPLANPPRAFGHTPKDP